MDQAGPRRGDGFATRCGPASTLGPGETVTPENAREALLETGRDAARQLGRWRDALDLNAAQAASLRDQRAPAADIARAGSAPTGHCSAWTAPTRHWPCSRTAVRYSRTPAIPRCSAWSSAPSPTPNISAATATPPSTCNGTRYASSTWPSMCPKIAVSYHSFGHYLHADARQPAPALACHLAAALIRALTDGTGRSFEASVTDLRESGTDADMPADVPGMCRQVGDIPGADLDRLLAALAPDQDALEQRFRELVAAVREAASQEQE